MKEGKGQRAAPSAWGGWGVAVRRVFAAVEEAPSAFLARLALGAGPGAFPSSTSPDSYSDRSGALAAQGRRKRS